MNKKPLAGLALVILLAMPLSALAEATAGEAVWTPPVVTAEEMEAAHLGERIVMRGQAVSYTHLTLPTILLV